MNSFPEPNTFKPILLSILQCLFNLNCSQFCVSVRYVIKLVRSIGLDGYKYLNKYKVLNILLVSQFIYRYLLHHLMVSDAVNTVKNITLVQTPYQSTSYRSREHP